MKHKMRIAVSILCALPLLGLPQYAAAQQPLRRGDCPGQDVWCSSGVRPQPKQCIPSRVGQVAVCWENGENRGYPPFPGCQNSPLNWCTYKKVSVAECIRGQSPARMFECTAQGRWRPVSAPEPPKFVFANFYIDNESQAKGWAEKAGDLVRNPVNATVAGDIGEKFGLPREFPEAYWRALGEIANTIAPSETTTNGEEVTGIFRSPDGYTFCDALLLDEPDIRQTRDHLVTYLGKVERLERNDGLRYKVIVPRIAGEQTWVKSHIRVVYVLADPQFVIRMTQTGKCVPHNTCIWLYEKGGPRRSNVANCNPNDASTDRWLAGRF
jgi:hypothetical protein